MGNLYKKCLYRQTLLKWIKGLNVRPETIKLLEKKHRGKLHDIDFGKDFLDVTPEAQATKTKIQK